MCAIKALLGCWLPEYISVLFLSFLSILKLFIVRSWLLSEDFDWSCDQGERVVRGRRFCFLDCCRSFSSREIVRWCAIQEPTVSSKVWNKEGVLDVRE